MSNVTSAPPPPPSDDNTTGLNPAQLSAVKADIHRPLAVVAGAGSGKTSVLTRRIEHLISHGGISPSSILAVTFTNAAADEMRARLETTIGRQAARSATISTFHSLAHTWCRTYAHLAGRPNDFSLFTGRQQLKVVRRAVEEIRVASAAAAGASSTTAPALPPDTDPSRLLSAIMRLKARGGTPIAAQGPALAAVYTRYEALMVESNAFDMLDLLLVARDALSAASPAAAAARAALRRRHAAVLVDEFQDTNLLQLELILVLCPPRRDGGVGACEAVAGSVPGDNTTRDTHCRLTVVGDDDQAIYAFQGATGSFAPIEDAFRARSLQRIVLEQNYRSTATIVNASSALVAHNTGRVAKTVFSRRAAGAPILVAECRTAADEARFIIRQVRGCLSGGARPRDIAVLFRTAKVGVALQAALASASPPLPFNTHATNLWETKAVRELVGVLTAVAKPHDDGALEASFAAIAPTHANAIVGALRARRRAAQPRRLAPRHEQATARSAPSLRAVAEQVRDAAAAGGDGAPPPPAKRPRTQENGGGVNRPPAEPNAPKGLEGAPLAAMSRVLATLDTLRKRVAVLQLEAVVARCVDALAARASLQAKPRSRAGTRLLNEAPDVRTALQIIQDEIRAYERASSRGTQPAPAVVPPLAAAASAAAAPPEVHAHASLRGLLQHLESARLQQEDRIARDNADALTLCSIHAAKGLEWRHVFVTRLNDGELPMVQGGGPALMEERRIAYVALSRAKERLYLSHVAVAPSGEAAAPSPFLAELPPSLLERVAVYE